MKSVWRRRPRLCLLRTGPRSYLEFGAPSTRRQPAPRRRESPIQTHAATARERFRPRAFDPPRSHANKQMPASRFQERVAQPPPAGRPHTAPRATASQQPTHHGRGRRRNSRLRRRSRAGGTLKAAGPILCAANGVPRYFARRLPRRALFFGNVAKILRVRHWRDFSRAWRISIGAAPRAHPNELRARATEHPRTSRERKRAVFSEG